MRSLFERPAYDARFTGGATRRPAILLLAMVLPLALLLSMLALTPLGHWQMDELLMMRAYRDQGLPALYSRIVNWSPRPFSEVVLYIYTWIVHATGRQLTGTFLMGLWGFLIAACLLPACLIRTRDPAGRRVPVLLALTLLALLVSGHVVSEVFYWTQAAGAYIPTIAFIASSLLCLVLVRQRSILLDAFVTVSVVLAAMSVEVGAFFAVSWGLCAPIALWFGRALWSNQRWMRWSDTQFLIPLGAGLAIFYMLATARFGSQAEIYDPSIAHHLKVSIWWTVTTYLQEVVSVGMEAATWTGTGLVLGLISKLALFAFCVLVFARVKRSASLDLKLLVTAFGLAAVASGVFSLFAAYYQFGVNCCQRHDTIRSQLGVVAVVAFAWVFAQLITSERVRKLSTKWVALASVVAVTASAAYLPSAIWSDLTNYSRIMQARAANWQAGHSDSQTMVLDLSHSGKVMGGIYVPGGTFDDINTAPRQIGAMMTYYGKTKIIAK